MSVCLSCEQREANFDERLCVDCAAFLGMISPELGEIGYKQIFLVARAARQALIDMLEREKPNPDEAMKPAAIYVAPTVRYKNARKFLYMSRLTEAVRDVPGDFVECGVGRGETFLYLLTICADNQRTRNVWGFDSFAGFPEPTGEDRGKRETRKGDIWEGLDGHDLIRILVGIMNMYGIEPTFVQSNATLVAGFFDTSLKRYPPGRKIALLHLDCDLYQSYQMCLETLWDRMSPGGIIALDEYNGTMDRIMFPGAGMAVDEFLARKNARVVRDEFYGKYRIEIPD